MKILRSPHLYAIQLGLILVLMTAVILSHAAAANSNIEFQGYRIDRKDHQIKVLIKVSGIQSTDPVNIRVTLSYMPGYHTERLFRKAEYTFERAGPGDHELDIDFELKRQSNMARFGTRYRMVVWVTLPGVDGVSAYYTQHIAYDLYA